MEDSIINITEFSDEELDLISQALRTYHGFLQQTKDNALGNEAEQILLTNIKLAENLIIKIGNYFRPQQN